MIGTQRPPAAPVRFPHLRRRLQGLGFPWPVLVALLLLLVGPLFVRQEYIIRLLTASLFFGIQALVFDFTGGFINAVNFGFAAFIGLGAYTSALLAVKLGVSPWLGIWAGALVAGLVGFGTGLLTLPLRGIYVSLMAWFVGLGVMALATAMVDVTRGARGLTVSPFFPGAGVRFYYYFLLVLGVLIYALLRGVIHSRVGLAFKAIGQNYDAAAASGVDAVRYKLLNFTLSCACAGLLGGFYAHWVGIITPDLLDTAHTMEVMALSYIGGSGSLIGGVVAAFLFVPAFDYLKKFMELRLLIYGVFLIVVMVFYPTGLAGLAHSVRARWTGRAKG